MNHKKIQRNKNKMNNLQRRSHYHSKITLSKQRFRILVSNNWWSYTEDKMENSWLDPRKPDKKLTLTFCPLRSRCWPCNLLDGLWNVTELHNQAADASFARWEMYGHNRCQNQEQALVVMSDMNSLEYWSAYEPTLNHSNVSVHFLALDNTELN